MAVSAHTEALAFRIWQFAEPLGWNCTHGEVAEAIGEPMASVRSVCALKQWSGRLRTGLRDIDGVGHYRSGGINAYSPITDIAHDRRLFDVA